MQLLQKIQTLTDASEGKPRIERYLHISQKTN